MSGRGMGVAASGRCISASETRPSGGGDAGPRTEGGGRRTENGGRSGRVGRKKAQKAQKSEEEVFGGEPLIGSEGHSWERRPSREH
jgi:hypothetical protein